jgi:hypothetical protein
MPNFRFGDTYCIDASEWDGIIEEISCCYLLFGKNIFEFWRGVAEIHLSTVLAATDALGNPPNRKRRFTVVQGGKRAN